MDDPILLELEVMKVARMALDKAIMKDKYRDDYRKRSLALAVWLTNDVYQFLYGLPKSKQKENTECQ